MDDKARIAELEAALAQREEEIANLLDVLIERHPPPVEWRLSASEARLVACLVRRGKANKSQLMLALYSGRIDDEPDPKIVDVLICKARKKLGPLGYEIKTQWGQGYFIEEDVRQRMRAQMGAS